MIEVARPEFLWAGALLAALPLALHFLRPRERSIRILPTARFLTEDSRTLVRLRRRPDEPLLLAMRMVLCVVLGAAFAGLSWVGPSRGTGHLVVVDGSPPMDWVWDELREAATAGIPGELLELALVAPGPDGTPRVTRFGPDELPAEQEWRAMRPSEGIASHSHGEEVRLAHLIRALRDGAGRAFGVDSISARLVTIPRWSAWGPGLPHLRDELWPARIELVVPTLADAPESAGVERSPSPPVRVRAPDPLLGRVMEALTLMGLDAVPVAEEDPLLPEAEEDPPLPEAARIHLWVAPESELWDEDPEDLWVPGAGTLASPDTALGFPPPAEDAFLLLDGRTIPGAGSQLRGTPGEVADVPMLRVGGRPAAAALRQGGLCRVLLPLDSSAAVLERGELVLVLESLMREGCQAESRFGVDAASEWTVAPGAGPSPPGPSPHEMAGARVAWESLLAAEGEPPLLEARPLRYGDAGIPLTRLLLAVGLGLAVLEALRARRADRMRQVGQEP